MLPRVTVIARQVAVLAAIVLACSLPVLAQDAAPPAAEQPQDTQQPQTPRQPPLAELAPVKLALDQIEAALRRQRLNPDALGELEKALGPVRDDLRTKLADFEERLARIDERRKQIGPAPAAGATPENPAIAAERARFDQAYGNVDAAVKQARLLVSRSDGLTARIAEQRRDLFAQRLLERTASVLDPFFWIEVAKAVPGEVRSVWIVAQSWLSYSQDNGGLPRIAAALGTLVVLALGFSFAVRWWRRRFGARVPRDSRSGKALASLGAFARGALKMPLIVVAMVQILEAFDLVPPRIDDIVQGLMIAVAVAAFGRGVARGALAPGRPQRRLTRFDDRTAHSLHTHMTWASRAFGATIFLLTLHRAIVAVPVLTVATRALFALVILALLLHQLFDLRQTQEEHDADAPPRSLWTRALAWLVVVGIAVSLIAGYAGLAYFIAERLLATVAIVAAFYLLIAASDALFADYVNSETPRARAIAINFGLNPRNVGLIATLVAGAMRVLLIVVALVLLVGPWQVSTASFIDRVRNISVGFEIGGITFSFGTVLGAVIVMIIILGITRAVQRWLERKLLPHSSLDPSLQLSIVTIFGYLGVIAAISFALAQLGIDLQKIAFIAGALSVGIGFGLQAIVSNFVSGLILLAERPIRVGDQIVVKGEEGVVRRISVRATEIQTGDQGSVIVPNTELITGLVKNRTHANMWGQIIIKVGVSYDSDPDKIREILMESALEHPKVIKSSNPSVQLASLGDNVLQFEVYAVITDLTQGGPIKSDIHFAILRRFRSAGIRIASPQCEVRLVGEGTHEAPVPQKLEVTER